MTCDATPSLCILHALGWQVSALRAACTRVQGVSTMRWTLLLVCWCAGTATARGMPDSTWIAYPENHQQDRLVVVGLLDSI